MLQKDEKYYASEYNFTYIGLFFYRDQPYKWPKFIRMFVRENHKHAVINII